MTMRSPDHKARTMGLIAQFKREITSLESRLSSAVNLTRLRGQKVCQRKRAGKSRTTTS
jgi:hypothetical protein